jgi:hypothetical protein
MPIQIDSPPGPRSAHPYVRLALLTAWVAGVLAGFYLLWLYAGSAGEAGPGAERWPTAAPAAPAADRLTVLVFAHPHCPCTRATVRVLARVLARHPDAAAVRVLFWTPPDAPPGWAETDLRGAAAALPGVTVQADAGGRQARQFGARTSGQVAVYDPAGRLLFRGGVTGARGHEGDNPGADAVAALLGGSAAPTPDAPCFGCPLFDPTDECHDGGMGCRN